MLFSTGGLEANQILRDLNLCCWSDCRFETADTRTIADAHLQGLNVVSVFCFQNHGLVLFNYNTMLGDKHLSDLKKLLMTMYINNGYIGYHEWLRLRTYRHHTSFRSNWVSYYGRGLITQTVLSLEWYSS